MDDSIKQMAAETLGITLEEVDTYSEPVPEVGGYYIWNPMRGGLSMIVNAEGERLVAKSAASYEMHLKAFLDGRRN